MKTRKINKFSSPHLNKVEIHWDNIGENNFQWRAIPMKKSNIFCVFVLVFILAGAGHTVLANNEYSSSTHAFQNPDDFYKNTVDKKDYQEFTGSSLNVRKRMLVKDLPKVFDEMEWKAYPNAWKMHLKKAMIGNTKDLKPYQQIYYFFTLKDDGEKIHIKFAIYDAKTGKINSQGGGHWTKQEFKRKFEQN